VSVAASGPRAGSGHGAREAGPASGTDPLPSLVSGLSRQNSGYRRMMAVCDKLAAAAVDGADAGELTRIFAATAGKTVLLLDPELRPQAQAASSGVMRNWDPGDASLEKLLGLLTAERRPIRVPPVPGSALACGCLAMPVIVGDTILGYLLVLDETAASPDDVDLIVASYAATLFALTLARTQTSLELGLRYRGAIVDSLVSGHFLDSQDARRKARILGVTDAQPFRVAVARLISPATAQPARPDEQDLAGELLARLAGYIQGAAAIRGPELVMFLPEQVGADPATRNTAARAGSPGAPTQLLLRRVGAASLTCGLSELTRLPELAPQALRQAQHAIDLGIRLGRAGQTICYEELGIYRLLLQVDDMHRLWQFAEDVLGPLIDYDARHKVGLVGTLTVYLNQHESLKQTARVLRVHVNTVTYRIQRIEQLTSLDLTNPDHRLSAHVATKIIESQRSRRPLPRTVRAARAPGELVPPEAFEVRLRGYVGGAGLGFLRPSRAARGAVVTIPEPGDIVGKIDAMVAPAPEPENAVLTDQTRVVRWTGPLFALFSLVLLPWTIYLAGSLPAEQVSTNYDAAWAGFDVLLMLALASTAYFALRRSRYLATAATATATLLVVDAWFDVLTTPGVQRIESILLAAFVELPLAAVCVWLSWHTQQLEEQRIVLLMRRYRGRLSSGRRRERA